MNYLMKKAKEVSNKAYCPYSNFRVGSAVQTEKGIFVGCNVENASFGLTSCAERNAIFSAIAAGARKIKEIAIYTPTDEATAPCGACRQVINEFGDENTIIYCGSKKEGLTSNLTHLLPHAFGPENLK